MEPGVFSISLAVKDIEASKSFYEKFGLKYFAGDGKHWVIMKNGDRQADEGSAGSASFMAVDPDGNPILVDQHV